MRFASQSRRFNPVAVTAWLALSLAGNDPANAAAQRVADIDQRALPRGSDPGNFVTLGAHQYFAATDEVSGRELWRTDGSAAGTTRFRDLCPGACSSNPRWLARIGDQLIFIADDGQHGSEFWVSDGTPAGTHLAVDLCPGKCHSGVDGAYPRPIEFGGRLLFNLWEPGTGVEPWITDGTPDGTFPLGDLCAGSCNAPALFLGQSASAVLLKLANGALYRSDGTQAGTFKLRDFGSCCETHRAIEFQGRLWFGANGDGNIAVKSNELWRTDTQVAATELAVDLAPGALASFAAPLFVFDEHLYVAAAFGPPPCPRPGPCVFREDGDLSTPLELSTDIFAPGERPGATLAVDGALFYFAGETLFVKRVGSPRQALATFPGAYTGFSLFPFGDGVAFSPTIPVAGGEFWVSDGTAAGTRRVFDLGGANPSWLTGLAATDDGILFAGFDGKQSEPWVTDGTAAGTRRLDVRPDIASSSPQPLATLGDILLFTATDGGQEGGFSGPRLLRSDGSAAGTRRLLSGSASAAVRWGAHVYFAGFEFPGGPAGLYRSDGHTATLLRDLPYLWELAIGRDGEGRARLFFSVLTPIGQKQLWSSDGTAEGTALVIDLDPDGSEEESQGIPLGQSPPPRQLTALTRGILFVGSGDDYQAQLWVSDGTAAGSRPIAEFAAIAELRGLDGRAVFQVPGAGVEELWSTDGTAAGTVKLMDLVRRVPVHPFEAPRIATRGTEAFVVAPGPAGLGQAEPGDLLWRTDGSPQGTYVVADLSRVGLPTTAARFRRELVVAGQRLFFVADNAATGRELWTSDGTAGGTRLLDLQPGPLGSRAEKLAPAGPGRVVFAAHDAIHGTEAWITDDSAQSASLLADALPGPDSSSPGPFLAADTKVYFPATEREVGRELWVADLEPAAAGCIVDGQTLCLRGERFGVRVHWRNQHTGGVEGTGRAVPDSSESGRFWFFSPDNVELAVKILDGAGVNDHFWVFATALSDLEYRLEVTDHRTGVTRTWRNPPGSLCGIADVAAFPSSSAAAPAAALAGERSGTKSGRGPNDLSPPQPELSLWSDRFRVAAAWVDPRTGTGGFANPIAYSENSGGFWIFAPSNLELLVKLLDGRPINGHPWLFWGALTHLDLTLIITDTETGVVEAVGKPGGEICADAAFDLF